MIVPPVNIGFLLGFVLMVEEGDAGGGDGGGGGENGKPDDTPDDMIKMAKTTKMANTVTVSFHTLSLGAK